MHGASIRFQKLLNDFIKKTRKTPPEDIQIAKKRAKKYEATDRKAYGK